MQYGFVNVLETRNDLFAVHKDRGYISRVEYFVNQSYVHELFESCRNVSISNVVVNFLSLTLENTTMKEDFIYIVSSFYQTFLLNENSILKHYTSRHSISSEMLIFAL